MYKVWDKIPYYEKKKSRKKIIFMFRSEEFSFNNKILSQKMCFM